jgi:hypothetical protein
MQSEDEPLSAGSRLSPASATGFEVRRPISSRRPAWERRALTGIGGAATAVSGAATVVSEALIRAALHRILRDGEMVAIRLTNSKEVSHTRHRVLADRQSASAQTAVPSFGTPMVWQFLCPQPDHRYRVPS